MNRSMLFPAVVVAAVLTFGGGCARNVNYETWRNDVEKYIDKHGGGDPSVLRDVRATPSHTGFRVISAERPSDSTDAVGLLVGNARISGRPWLVFLVGLVDRQEVEEIRIAALSAVNNQYTWRTGPEDEQATRTYINYNKGLAHRRFPSRRRDEPVEYLGFPREEDRFELTTQDERITVTHPPSGARWSVSVDAPQQQARR